MSQRYRVRKLEAPVRHDHANLGDHRAARWTTEPRYVIEEEKKKWFSDGFYWTRVTSYWCEGASITLGSGGMFVNQSDAEHFMERYIRIEHPEVVRIVEVEL